MSVLKNNTILITAVSARKAIDLVHGISTCTLRPKELAKAAVFLEPDKKEVLFGRSTDSQTNLPDIKIVTVSSVFEMFKVGISGFNEIDIEIFTAIAAYKTETFGVRKKGKNKGN